MDTKAEVQKTAQCKHEMIEDELFACGAIMIIEGTVGDLGEMTRFNCKKCGFVDYQPKL